MSYAKLSLYVLLLGVTASHQPAYAAEDENTGIVLAVGKLNATLCRIKVQGASFPNSCATAVYQEAYFMCDATQGKDTLAIALAARISGTPVRITTNACSPNGSSVANLVGIHID